MGSMRVKCNCGHVMNAFPGNVCPKCRNVVQEPQEGILTLYRMGSPLGIAGGFGIYVDGAPMGHIGNKETLHIVLPYGAHNIHVASGMNRRCQDLVVNLTPENREAFAKVYMKPGFLTNKFVINPSSPAEMPERFWA